MPMLKPAPQTDPTAMQQLVQVLQQQQPGRKMLAWRMAGNMDPQKLEQYQQLARILGVSGMQPQTAMPPQANPPQV